MVFAHLVRWAFIMQNQYPVGEVSVVGLAMERRIWVYRILVSIIKKKIENISRKFWRQWRQEIGRELP